MRRLSAILAVAAAYAAAGKLGLQLAIIHPNATAVWAPTGIALASLLLLGAETWPGIFLGAFLVNVTTAGTFLSALGIAAGNTLEGLAAAALVSRFAGGRKAFETTGDYFRFVVLAGFAATMVSATLGVLTLTVTGLASWADAGGIWLTWWLGDMVGAILVTPALVLWADKPPRGWSLREGLEAAALVAGLLLVTAAVFWGWVPSRMRSYPLGFLALPFLLWTAFSFGPPETSAAVLLVAGSALCGTIKGMLPLGRLPPNDALLVLQAFLGVTGVTAQAIAIEVSVRRRTAAALQESRDLLEERVLRRTEELIKTNEALAAEIAERESAQEALREKSEELTRSNAELQMFASVASHDLQEPLNKIIAFSDLLKRRAEGLSESSQGLLARIRKAAERMSKLVEAVLEFSAVAGGKRPLEMVDLREVVADVLSDLEARIDKTQAAVEVGPLPTLPADRVQIEQLFLNLLSNAIKFHRKDTPPKVRVSGLVRPDGFAEITVFDEGVGFDAKHAERIFEPLLRLFSREEYEGHGLGLAICRRIAARHGGSITATSAPGQGTTFTIVLPAGKTAAA